MRTILVIFGICWLAFGVHRIVNQYRTRDWFLVRGRVVTSDVEQPYGRLSDWLRVVRYDYMFRETCYQGKHVPQLARGDFRWLVKLTTRRYKVGDPIDVFVNSSDPEASSLFAGIQPLDSFMYTVPPLALIVVAIYGVF